MIKIQPNKLKTTNQKINEFEKTIGYNLPKNYFDFLVTDNGGKPEPNLCKTKNNKQITINSFFGIGLNDELNELEKVIKVFKNRIPKKFIPIASADGGNLICLSLTNSIGEVYYWNHEEESDEGEEPTIKKVNKIADNFSSFLEMMEQFDSSKIEIKKEDIISIWVDPEFLKEMQNK